MNPLTQPLVTMPASSPMSSTMPRTRGFPSERKVFPGSMPISNEEVEVPELRDAGLGARVLEPPAELAKLVGHALHVAGLEVGVEVEQVEAVGDDALVKRDDERHAHEEVVGGRLAARVGDEGRPRLVVAEDELGLHLGHADRPRLLDSSEEGPEGLGEVGGARSVIRGLGEGRKVLVDGPAKGVLVALDDLHKGLDLVVRQVVLLALGQHAQVLRAKRKRRWPQQTTVRACVGNAPAGLRHT